MSRRNVSTSLVSMPSTEHLNATVEDELSGTRVLRDTANGCLGSSEKAWLPKLLRLAPVEAIMFSKSTKNLWWSEGGRFIINEIRSLNTTKTPMNRVRWTVRCMACEVINKTEVVWTGHKGGEVYVWADMGKKIQNIKISRSPVTAMCIVSSGIAWVGFESGNIKILELDMSETPAQLRHKTTVVPGLAPVSRIVMSKQNFPKFLSPKNTQDIQTTSSLANDIIPEGEESDYPSTADHLRLVTRSASSFAINIRDAVTKKFPNRAHNGQVRCIFSRGGRVWTSGGNRIWAQAQINVWNETDKSLLGKFICQGKGPCSCMASIPWNDTPSPGMDRIEDWRLLTAHETGKILLWNPRHKLQPLLELEFRKSPIRALIIFESMGLMCTGHKDGTIEIGKLISPAMRIRGLSTSTPISDEDQNYPFVPRKISECLHPSGLHMAVGGTDCLFTLSNSGRILYWPREKLKADLGHLRQSSISQMQIMVNNPSVMNATRDDIVFGNTIYDGDFATVRLGKFFSEDVVIKEANDKADSKRAMQALVKDARILSGLRHQNIVSIMAVGDNPPFIVMQYYEEGSLFDVLKKARMNSKYNKRLNLDRRLNILIGIAKGMVFLHNQPETILHRDLKSPNVFIEKDFFRAAVGDFNLSKENYGETFQQITSSVRPSNPMWLAPEVARGETDFTIASDIYAFAIIMWEVLTGRTPWDYLKPAAHNISRDIFYGKIRYDLFAGKRPELRRDESGKPLDMPPGKFPQVMDYVRLMEECWESDLTKRIKNFARIVERLEEIRKEYTRTRSNSVSLLRTNENSKDSDSQTTSRGNVVENGTERGQSSNSLMVPKASVSELYLEAVDPVPSPFEQCISPFEIMDNSNIVARLNSAATTSTTHSETRGGGDFNASELGSKGTFPLSPFGQMDGGGGPEECKA